MTMPKELNVTQKFQRTIDNMRLVASTWSDPIHDGKRKTLESFALELERICAESSDAAMKGAESE